MKTYGDQCGSCEHLNINDRVGFKYKCTERGGYHTSEERSCYKYEYCDSRDYYSFWKRENSIWHIVTAICEILGLSDKYECVNYLHNFRFQVLDNDPVYRDMLREYDVVGPILADNLRKDPQAKEISRNLIKVYLLPVLDLIKCGEYDLAVNKYLEMVNLLKAIYNYDDITKNNNELISTKGYSLA